MILEAVEGGLLVGDFIYHRARSLFSEGSMVEHGEAKEVPIPLVAEGSPIPMYFGRVRVRAPIVAAVGTFGIFSPSSWDLFVTSEVSLLYGVDMFFVLGIPFYDGVNRIHSIWGGDVKLYDFSDVPTVRHLDDLTGDGDHEQPGLVTTPLNSDATSRNMVAGQGIVEFLNGNSGQLVTSADGLTSKTCLADRLTTLGLGDVEPKRFGHYRRYTSVFLFGGEAADGSAIGDPPSAVTHMRWLIGPNPTTPAHSFEVSTYPNASLDHRTVGDEANPADVLYAVLRDAFGKLGLDPDLVDYESFRAAAETLRIEGHGYSRSHESLTSAKEVIEEILKQIDGAIDEDPLDGRIKLKLIRADYDPTTIPCVTVDNCESVENFASGGWSGIINKVRVTYEDRLLEYETQSVSAQNQANAVGQNGEVSEIVIDYPGVKTQALATLLAARELDVRSRPLAKMTVTVDRSFLPTMVGDPIMVRWPLYQITGRVFRAARISRGGATSNKVTIDLIEDVFYLYRFEVTDGAGLPSFPSGVVG